jgi:hypothetical protein
MGSNTIIDPKKEKIFYLWLLVITPLHTSFGSQEKGGGGKKVIF